MLDRPITAQAFQIVRVDMPVVDLVAACAAGRPSCPDTGLPRHASRGWMKTASWSQAAGRRHHPPASRMRRWASFGCLASIAFRPFMRLRAQVMATTVANFMGPLEGMR